MPTSAPLQLTRVMSVLLCVLLSVGANPIAQVRAEGSATPLRCAVEGERQISKDGKLCERLAAALGRPMPRVRDAREHGVLGDAIQILAGDVEWIVALLKNGQVRAWTRVSKTYAQGKELQTIARVTRALLAQKVGKNERCVRVEPNGGRRMRGFDLAYPWVELKECAARFSEVPDPWWNDER